jgi:hypothetical protein
MKAKHFWLASVLVAASALATASARASDEVIVNESSAGCTNCGAASGYHFGANLNIFHIDHAAWFTWRPGQVLCGLHAKVDAKIQSAIDCIHSPTCAGAKGNQPIQPQYMYNPYSRGPRDYFMSDR